MDSQRDQARFVQNQAFGLHPSVLPEAKVVHRRITRDDLLIPDAHHAVLSALRNSTSNAQEPTIPGISHLANDATEHNASNPYCHLNPCTCPPRSKLNHLGNHGWLGTGLRRYRSLLGHRIPANAN